MSYAEARKRIAEQGDSGQADPPCTRCGCPTPAATLISFGARCGECYAAYCRNTKPMPGLRVSIPDDAGRLAWAYRLRTRHEAGERIVPALVEMYRDALRGRERNDAEDFAT